MKKSIAFVLLLLLVATALVGCYGHRLVAKEGLPPTCTSEGYTDHLECKDIWCNYKEGYKVLPIAEHSFVVQDAKEATPYENGHTAYEECSVCHTTQGYETTFYVYPVCELLPAVEERPLVKELPPKELGELVGIYEALMRFDESYALASELTVSDVEKLMGYLNLLFPELIHCGNGYSYKYSEDIVSEIIFEYTMNREDYTDAMEIINERVSGVVAATRDMNELEREIYVHNYIIDVCEYKIDAEHSGDAYGALALGKAKCDGYAKAFALLMMSTGSECYTVSGVADEGPHAWNVVLIDSEYYNVDVTWDDGEAMYAYFNIVDTIFDKTHLTDEKYEALVPECRSMELSIPYINGTHIAADEDIVTRLDAIASAECEKERVDVHFRVETPEQFEYLSENVGDAFTKYLETKYGRFRFSMFTHDGAGYMRFVVDVINE